eukprot:5267-Eustigmatos_ZCMA.PRE.1
MDLASTLVSVEMYSMTMHAQRAQPPPPTSITLYRLVQLGAAGQVAAARTWMADGDRRDSRGAAAQRPRGPHAPPIRCGGVSVRVSGRDS